MSKLILILATVFSLQAQPEKDPADVSGKWQVSWQGRLGAEHGLLNLQQEGAKLTGTFQDVHGVSALTGTINEKRISYEVRFQGARPFTIHFTGTLDGDNIQGVSQATGIGSTSAYLGHGGEIVQPEHPWSAKRDSQ